jgi:hypothetical protein
MKSHSIQNSYKPNELNREECMHIMIYIILVIHLQYFRYLTLITRKSPISYKQSLP